MTGEKGWQRGLVRAGRTAGVSVFSLAVMC